MGKPLAMGIYSDKGICTFDNVVEDNIFISSRLSGWKKFKIHSPSLLCEY